MAGYNSRRWLVDIMTKVAECYPPIEPHETGLLDVRDGNQVYWKLCGNRMKARRHYQRARNTQAN